MGSNSEKLILRFLWCKRDGKSTILLTWVVAVYARFSSGSWSFIIGDRPLTLVFEISSRLSARDFGSVFGNVCGSASSQVRFLRGRFSGVFTSSMAPTGMGGSAAFITEIPFPIACRFQATALTASSSLKLVVCMVSGLRRSFLSLSRSRSRKKSSRLKFFFSSFTKNFYAWLLA